MRCRPAGREGRERRARGGKRALRDGGKEAPRGEWEPRDAASAVERRRSPGGRGGGWRSAFPPRPVSPLGLSPCPSSPPGAGVASPRRAPWRACLVPGLRPPAPRLPRGGRVEGLGRGARVRRRRRLRPRRRSFPVAAAARYPPARLGTRGAAAGPRGAFRGGWFGSARPPPGGPQSLGSRGLPAGRRLPPPALDGSLSVRRTSALTLPFPAPCLSAPAPPAQASGPGSAPRLPRPRALTPPRAPCLPVPRFPLQPLALCGERGLGSRVRGGTRLWGKESFGVPGKGEGSGPPPAALGGGKGWGRGRCRVSA